MARWTSFAVGVIGLAALEAVVSSSAASSRLGGLLNGPAKFVAAFMDPGRPVFSSSSKTASTSTSSSSSSGTTVIAPVSSITPQIPYAPPPGGPPTLATLSNPGGSI